jgi:hypothetical protein
MPENKADLVAFPSVQLSTVTYGDRDAVVADGFVDEDKAFVYCRILCVYLGSNTRRS